MVLRCFWSFYEDVPTDPEVQPTKISEMHYRVVLDL